MTYHWSGETVCPRRYDIPEIGTQAWGDIEASVELGGWEGTTRERHQGDHRTADLGLREEAVSPDRDMDVINGAKMRS